MRAQSIWIALIVLTVVGVVGCAIMNVRDSDQSKPQGVDVLSNLEELELEISSDSGESRREESILVKLKLRNASTSTVCINGRFSILGKDFPSSMREVYFDIVSQSGDTVMFPLIFTETRALVKQDFVFLRPGEVVEHDYDLGWLALEPGVYSVTATYENHSAGSEFGLDALVGSTRSNTLETTIRDRR